MSTIYIKYDQWHIDVRQIQQHNILNLVVTFEGFRKWEKI